MFSIIVVIIISLPRHEIVQRDHFGLPIDHELNSFWNFYCHSPNNGPHLLTKICIQKNGHYNECYMMYGSRDGKMGIITKISNDVWHKILYERDQAQVSFEEKIKEYRNSINPDGFNDVVEDK
jgi:hypothetical protein